MRKCLNKKTKQIWAVKIIKKDVKLSSALQMDKIRLFYEIEMMKWLDHPNILKLCEIFQDDKRYYLVTELCTGGELHDEI